MPTDESTLGSALRAARESAGKTVEQVSATTRIRSTLIRDLEADKFESSMGRVYARGHVKAIAAAVGTDPTPLLALFDAAQADEEPPPAVEDIAAASAPSGFDGSVFAASASALHPERRTPRWGSALAVAGAVLIGLVALGYMKGGTSPSPQVVAGPSASPSQANVVRTPAPDSVASKPAVTGAQLRLRVIGGQSWVSVSNATTTLFEGIMHSGEFKDFNDPTRLKVVVGNALPVNLNCGGKDSGPAGAAGQVKRFECTATGLKPL